MIDLSKPHWRGIDFGLALDRPMTEAEYLKAQRKAREEARAERKARWLGYALGLAISLVVVAVLYSTAKDIALFTQADTAKQCLADPAWCAKKAEAAR